MSSGDLIGSLGVAILLAAYVAHLRGWVRSDARAYHAMNVVGAGLACLASYLIAFWPFVILEATWMAAAAYALLARGSEFDG